MNDPLVVFFDAPGMTAAQYDRIIAGLDAAGLQAPDGRLSHVAWATDGGWRVVDVWASEAQFGRFAETLGPLIGEAVGPNGPRPDLRPAHSFVPAAAAAVS
jgi:hypothetical protein